MEKEEKNKLLSQEDIMKILDTCYDKSMQGIPQVSPAVEQIATEYMEKYPTTEQACKVSSTGYHSHLYIQNTCDVCRQCYRQSDKSTKTSKKS